VEDTELIEGLVFNSRAAGAGGPSRVEKAKIGFVQFCISPPKTDVSKICGLYFVKSVVIVYLSTPHEDFHRPVLMVWRRRKVD
jgi:hypothetical protein